MGYVYFLGDDDGGPVKVGFAKNSVNKRLTVLQTGYPRRLSVMAVINDVSIGMESAIHRFLSDQKMHGEWFERTPCVQDLINAVNNGEITKVEDVKSAVYVPDDFDAVKAIVEIRKLEKRIAKLEEVVSSLRGTLMPPVEPERHTAASGASRAAYMREYRKRSKE